jgi:hypothetical protein
VVARRGGETVSLPEWWTDDLRDRVASEAAALMLHLGSHAPNLDEFTTPMMAPSSGNIYFRVGDNDVFAHRAAMAFHWRFNDDDSVYVAGYRLGRRVAAADVPKDAVPKRTTAKWN